MNSILSHCCVPFTPIDFHYIKNRAQFFVQDASTASALKDVNCKICDEENQKISIFVNPCTEPNTLQNKFTPEKMEKLMLTMNKRYDVSQQALDLQKLRFDPDLMEHDIDMILNRRQCMFATLQIIERNFPELLSLNLCNNKLYWLDGLSDIVEKAPQVKILNLSKNELRTSKELEKLKGMELEELWLEGNPLCSDFPEQSAYVRPVSITIQTLAWDHVALSWKYLHWLDYHPLFLFFFRNSLEEYFKDNRNIKKHKDPCKSVIREAWHEKYDVKDSIISHGATIFQSPSLLFFPIQFCGCSC
uniref:Uncharacterized protein n=1 Tax=Urocitellus parryii TaxID=9999 RepID=A0A8D2KJZ6_UROPR